ncbi:Fic family protein [Alterisphingorhabdus coralli]|uniref:Fic family protein n=1 Tax=Alterisphingorhabdus coralli TaxID=3071408 RepID=A0AA97F739_9SPHN|nr:Fic family protein [Parasphingorhabdus sp. SCSIO 66989]WOE75151.1 Fic family protein [Parasphingorhabdus sp. SCSIO 66989]
MNFDALTAKKKLLDDYRPLAPELVRNLDDWFRVELTYTSNAIEGNTLTRRETALVVDKGITVGGKSLVEHLETTNHARALDWVRAQIARTPASLTEKDILHIHEVILKGIDDANCGHYRSVPVRISGSAVVLPNPRKVPDLMHNFILWLRQSAELHPIDLAAEAHYRLVTIHPFVDGNGRSARLLMNMLLLMSGYPPAIIRKQDRLAYIASLEKAQTGGTKEDHVKIIAKAVDRSLDIYLRAAAGEEAEPEQSDTLLKIGELAKQVDEANSTIRHWTKEGLLSVAEITEAGYQLYAPEMIQRVKQIQTLKAQRFTLKEIREKLP